VVLKHIAEELGLDPQLFYDLTDVLAENSQSLDMLSASLLRICKYSGEQCATISDATVAPKLSFGAHTDSSFVTLGLVSSSSGLEIADQMTNTWISVERDGVLTRSGENNVNRNAADAKANRHVDIIDAEVTTTAAAASESVVVIVFVGEFLQVLTKNRFSAAVHRVKDSGYVTSELTGAQVRYSCPFLIRGRHSAIIDMKSSKYVHPGGEDAVSSDKVPDLDGISVKAMHKLLDLKRQKCFRDNNSREGEWVLSAFPIVPPLETTANSNRSSAM
jgi:hypothetical protein